MCACWRVTWQAPTAQLRYLLTLSDCRLRHCRLLASPGAPRGAPIGMAPLARRTTDLTDTRAIIRRPMLPILTPTEKSEQIEPTTGERDEPFSPRSGGPARSNWSGEHPDPRLLRGAL